MCVGECPQRPVWLWCTKLATPHPVVMIPLRPKTLKRESTSVHRSRCRDSPDTGCSPQQTSHPRPHSPTWHSGDRQTLMSSLLVQTLLFTAWPSGMQSLTHTPSLDLLGKASASCHSRDAALCILSRPKPSYLRVLSRTSLVV